MSVIKYVFILRNPFNIYVCRLVKQLLNEDGDISWRVASR